MNSNLQKMLGISIKDETTRNLSTAKSDLVSRRTHLDIELLEVPGFTGITSLYLSVEAQVKVITTHFMRFNY